MHDFDYDAMQKKRIARGASHMKHNRKGCSLPSDYLTAAQKRRLNGPVSTYKLDEPMSWESFKAMPEDLQKKYILNLQETYQANNDMLGKMFGVTGVSVCKMRHALGIGAMGQSKMTRDEVTVRDAKWDAFCNGVVGGKPGEVEDVEIYDDIDKFISSDDCTEEPEQIEIREMEPVEEPIEEPIDILIPDRVSVSFTINAEDIGKAFEKFKLVTIPKGKVCIRFEVEAV